MKDKDIGDNRILLETESVRVSKDKLAKLKVWGGSLRQLMDEAIDMKLAHLEYTRNDNLEGAIKIIKGEA